MVGCFEPLWNIYNWKPAQLAAHFTLSIFQWARLPHPVGCIPFGLIIPPWNCQENMIGSNGITLWKQIYLRVIFELLIWSKSFFEPSFSLIFSLQTDNDWIPCALLLFGYIADLNHTANISDSNESRIPHFSEFHSRLLKLLIREKIPDRPLEKPLKSIRDISE